MPDPARVDGWHQALLGNNEQLDYLEVKRGLDLETVRRFGLGWHSARITIPVYDETVELANIRMYSPLLEPKMINWPGFGSPPRLWPIETFLEDDPEVVMVCEGEFDAMISIQNQIPTITCTGGVKSMWKWRDTWTAWLEGREVWLCFDRDAEGRKTERIVSDALREHVDLGVIHLPYPMGSKKDLTDFFLDGGDGDKLSDLVKAPPRDAPKPKPKPKPEPKPKKTTSARKVKQARKPTANRSRKRPERKQAPEKYKATEYDELRKGAMVDKPIQITATISAINKSQMTLPEQLRGRCNYDWDPKRCAHCPLKEHGGDLTKNIKGERALHLDLFGIASDEARQKRYRKILGAPERCPNVKITSSNFTVWDCEIRNGSNLQEEAFPLILHLDKGLPVLNSPYLFDGRLVDAPRQRALFFADKAAPAAQDLDTFDITDLDVEKARAWVSDFKGEADEKIEQIARRLELHVTKMFGQPLLHMAIDLTYHSILQFPFGEEIVTRGWMESLCVGDTRSGKSETAKRLQALYARGYYQSAENASVPGLLFGMEKRGSAGGEGAWSGSIGLLPLNHRQLVILDEASGLRKDQISQMSDMRSRGVAEINKIRAMKTPAQVRLVWIANPRVKNAYKNGLDALADQMGMEEDLARIDIPLYAVKPPRSELDKQRNKYGKLSKVEIEVIRWLVTWAWSRKPEQVSWSQAATKKVYELAEKLAEHFDTDRAPVLPRTEAALRLARMAVAVAARLFSSPDGHRLNVNKDHVYGAYELFVRFLDDPNLGVVETKEEEVLVEEAGDVHSVELRQDLLGWPRAISEHLTNAEFKDFGSIDRDGMFMTKLTNLRAIRYKAASNSYEVSHWAQEIARGLNR